MDGTRIAVSLDAVACSTFAGATFTSGFRRVTLTTAGAVFNTGSASGLSIGNTSNPLTAAPCTSTAITADHRALAGRTATFDANKLSSNMPHLA